MADATQADGMIRVWDPLVRIGHWVLVAGFATAYLTEGEPEWLHVWAGYVIAGTVALRLLWGMIGPQRARFSDFVTGPGRAVAYLRDLIAGRAERHVGHSPAGGAMTVALLVMLGVTAIAGMGTLAAEEGGGPLAGFVAQMPEAEEAHTYSGDHDDDHGEDSAWKEVHEVAANLTLILILLHLGGVALASLQHRENLARSMVTGDKRV